VPLSFWSDRLAAPGCDRFDDLAFFHASAPRARTCHAGLAIGPGGNTVYAASANGGVFIHPQQRLLRAATHGRGVYEIPI
jgi:hypothetical protein